MRRRRPPCCSATFSASMRQTVWTLLGLGIVAVAALAVISRPLLFASLQPELAEAKGVSLRLVSVLFLAIVALAVAECAQIVGVLLVFALMVGPAATAQQCTTRFWHGIAFVRGAGACRGMVRPCAGFLHRLADQLLDHRAERRVYLLAILARNLPSGSREAKVPLCQIECASAWRMLERNATVSFQGLKPTIGFAASLLAVWCQILLLATISLTPLEHRRRSGRERSDLPRRRRDTAGAAEAGPSRARLRPVRDLPVARIAAGHPVADARRCPTGNPSPSCGSTRRISARAAGASGRRRPTARTTLPDLSLDFRTPAPDGAGVANSYQWSLPAMHRPTVLASLAGASLLCQRTRIRTRLRRPAYVRQHADHRRSERGRRSVAADLLLPAAAKRRRPGIQSLRDGIRVRQAHHREFRLLHQRRIPVAHSAGHEDRQRLGELLRHAQIQALCQCRARVHDVDWRGAQLRAHRCNRRERRDAGQ